MAVNDVFRQGVDYSLGTQVNSPVSAKTAFIQAVRIVGDTGGSGSGPATGTATSVASLATDQLILAANPNRKGFSITNTDANPLLLLLAAGVSSATNFTVQVNSGAYYESPFGYTGNVRGLWTVDGAGFAYVTEYT